MPWSSLATNQCVSLNNLRDAIANGIFVAISAVPTGTKEITKTEALAYVDIQTSPLASKASNQLVVKNNLNAKVYTYNRYDLNLTSCTTSNPIPVWSYLNIPYGSYKINGLYIYQIIPTTHTTFNNQITSYESYTCTPVTIYTYQTSDVNPTTCALSNTVQWWSYNNYTNGYYYINGPGTLYSLSASTHTNYTNQITSVTGATCGGSTIYYYKLYTINTATCVQTFFVVVRSNNYYANGYYIVSTSQQDYVYLESTTAQSYYPAFSVISTASSCTPNPCMEYVLHNTNPLGNGASETFTYINCAGTSTTTTVAAYGYAYACVKPGTTPNTGSLGDVPYTLGFTCT